MNNKKPTVFITGVTGNQGSWLAKKLRDLDWTVHATVRDLNAPKALKAAALGVQLTLGDWDDESALRASMTGCDKLFLCLTTDPEEPDRERRKGARMVHIAKAVGVKQVVSSTSLGVCMYPNDPRLTQDSLVFAHQVAKKGLEQAISDASFDSYTFLRPGYFMSNFLEPLIGLFDDILDKGDWRTALTPDTQIGLIDPENIADIAVVAFQDPHRLNGRAIALASELLSPQETMNILGPAMGRRLTTSFMTDAEIAAVPFGPAVIAKCEKIMRYMDDYLDMKELSTLVPLTSFKDFLQREKEGIRKF